MVMLCWRPSVKGDGSRRGGDPNGRFKELMWYKDLGVHANGEFSMAVIQANNLMEDQSQLESGPLSSVKLGPHGTFVGVYDGHGGPETSRFINNALFSNLKEFASEHQEISADALRKAFLKTEEEFLSLVKRQWHEKPQIVTVGSCCLAGVICSGLLYIANVGDSRAVLGRVDKAAKSVTAIQLSTEHNASIESVRDELRGLHPQDSRIVVLKHNVWRVKGLIQAMSARSYGYIGRRRVPDAPSQMELKILFSDLYKSLPMSTEYVQIPTYASKVSRSIGDAYLKKSEFNQAPLLARFRLPEPFTEPILSAEPSISVHKLSSKDQFVIFASDGLWDHLSNQEAVDIVHSHPRNGIARKLIKAALHVAAKKREMRYSDLKKIDRGVRRHFHDDITVVVVFIDPYSMNRSSSRSSILSIRGGTPSSPKL